ncbi:hypoxanthine phosphoribosyltransferase [bacterium]|nr:hypoxanthine phosphoribosyltransferase [bacterium]
MEHLKISPLIAQEQIQKRVKEIAKEITNNAKGKSLVAIGVLKGSFLFYADLIREIELDMICDFCGASSYGDDTKSSGEVRLTMDLQNSIHGKDVLLIEDIVDTGLTMNFLKKHLSSKKPASITTASFLLKPASLKEECSIDHVGFEVENDFVVGYGLDYQGHFRQLPYVARVENMN